MRSTAEFDDLAAYRGFIDEIVSRRNARNANRIDHERAAVQALPDRRTSDYEEVIVRVTSSGGFTLRKVFYTVPSRLIGHQLRVRLYDDRLDVFVGGTHLVTLPRGRPHPNGKHDQVVDCWHVIHSLRRKPMALLNLVHRDRLFPRDAYGRTFDCLRPRLPDRKVDLLALAHERGCEAELAEHLAADHNAGQLPTGRLCAYFAPDPACVPHVVVQLAPQVQRLMIFFYRASQFMGSLLSRSGVFDHAARAVEGPVLEAKRTLGFRFLCKRQDCEQTVMSAGKLSSFACKIPYFEGFPVFTVPVCAL